MTTPQTTPWATFTPENIPAAELYQQFDTDKAAAFLSIPKRNLEMMRHDGTGPQFVRVGRRAVRYRLLDLIRYQEMQLRRNTLQDKCPNAQ